MGGEDLISVLVSEEMEREESSTHSMERGNKSPLRSFPVLKLYDSKMTLAYSLETQMSELGGKSYRDGESRPFVA